MTSNEKTQNYKVVDLVLHPSSYEKDMIFLKSDLVTPAGWRDKTVLSRRWERYDKVDTWNMSWQTISERSEACQRGTFCHPNACGATVYFCHATQTGATKRVRFANIYLGGLFLK